MTLSSLRSAKCRGLSEGVWGLCPRQHLRPKSRRKRRLASETPRCGSVCGCLPQQGRPFTRRVYFAEKGTLHLVGSKSAPFGTALCPSLTPLPCPSSPHRNRFAGLRWGWEWHQLLVEDKFLTASTKRFMELCRNYEVDYPFPRYNGLF